MHDPLTDRILKLVERRDRFEGEIRAELKDEPPENVDRALGMLRVYLSDERTLDAYLRAHEGRRTLGRERMRADLDSRHAPADLVESKLTDLPPEADRAENLLVAERKARTRAQAGRFLLSRGFEEDAVESALERVFGESGSSEG